ncbi:holin [Streptomyces sp. NPDC097640]|uniref:holin n=1 Tax=Streptomyces sp. NPDC097640 TaxID=3157229 RepID=UPI0033337676
MPRFLYDLAERTILTYVETFLGLLLASGVTDLVDISTAKAAAIAALPAALAVVKSAAGSLLGNNASAAWLPAGKDPAAPRPL